MRPPAGWFSREWARQNAKNPGLEKLKISQMVVDAWDKLSQENKTKIHKEFSLTQNPLGTRPVTLPCPKCNTDNPVHQAGIYIRCKKCHNPLVVVRIRKK